MDSDQATVIFCITEESARAAALAGPEHAVAVNRMNAQRSFLVLQLRLAGVAPERIEALVRGVRASQV